MNARPSQSTFTLAEIRAFKYLAVICGAIALGIGFVAHNVTAQLLGVALAAVILVAAPFTVYVLRRRKRSE